MRTFTDIFLKTFHSVILQALSILNDEVTMRTSRLWRTILCAFMLSATHVTGEGNDDVEVLGLAEEAFDDQYLGCRQAMEEQLEARGTLKAELSANRLFQHSWKEAEGLWSSKIKDLVTPSLPEGFTDHHGVALVAFTGHIREIFYKAVKSAGRSYQAYAEEFNFKYLHYYVTVALQLLSKNCTGAPQVTYRGFENVIYLMPEKGTHVRFGHFLHTSADLSVAYEMGNASFFMVQSCSGVPVDKFSDYPKEQEVVFPGYELFRVTQVYENLNEFSLTGTGKYCSNFNCAFIKGEASKMSLRDCMGSENDVTRPDRGARLHNKTEKVFSAAPPGPLIRSGTTALMSMLIAAVVTLFAVTTSCGESIERGEGGDGEDEVTKRPTWRTPKP